MLKATETGRLCHQKSVVMNGGLAGKSRSPVLPRLSERGWSCIHEDGGTNRCHLYGGKKELYEGIIGSSELVQRPAASAAIPRGEINHVIIFNVENNLVKQTFVFRKG